MLVRELNVKLKKAWQIIQDETCSLCGMPSWYGRNNDSNVAFEPHRSVCRGCQAVAKAEEKARGKDHKHEPGVTHYVTPKPVMKGTKLPTRTQWLRGVSTLADLPEFAGYVEGPKNDRVAKEGW